jgi:uncharacterized protein
MNLFDARLEVKSLSDSGVFSGYGSVFGNVDEGGDVVQKGAFGSSLADHAAKGTMPALLWQHRSGEPIGAYTKMAEDDNGLLIEGQLALKTQRGMEAYELLKMKAISGLSIGFQTRDDSFDQKTGVRTIKQADLWEVSLVTFPMNDQARVAAVKAIEQIDDLKGFERYLRDAGGVSRAEATALVSQMHLVAQRDAAKSRAEADAILAAIGERVALLSVA